jgi:hypothetical protein
MQSGLLIVIQNRFLVFGLICKKAVTSFVIRSACRKKNRNKQKFVAAFVIRERR